MIGSTNAGSGLKTILSVTVVDYTQTGQQAGRTVTVTNGTVTQTAVTNSGGQAFFMLKSVGAYSIESDVPEGYNVEGATVEAILGGTYSVQLAMHAGFHLGMSFDATVFQTDPTGCLTYKDDCAGFTPVSGPGSSLSKCSTIGSWEMRADGTSANPLLNKCFYATFDSSGVLHEKLNPQDLTQVIATWDNSAKEWSSASGSSHITTEDTMFCIPTLYFGADESSIDLFESAYSGRQAYAHTIGGHVYQYLALGVYEGFNNSGKLMSWSGKTSTASVTRPSFRTYATSKTVQNGHAMLWNFYQWTLWKVMTFFAMKSFNGQTQIGQGGLTYNSGVQGRCNAMGPFAGSTSASESTSTSVKAFLENPWGYKYEFIDDFVVDNKSSTEHDIWAGQNAVPDDTYSAPAKSLIYTAHADSGFAKSISTAAESWGLPETMGGSNTVGLCDYTYFTNSGRTLGYVGGYSSSVSSGSAGPSCLDAGGVLSDSGAYGGARLAFVFDL